MDEMRQLQRIMTKLMPESLRFVPNASEGGGNKVRPRARAGPACAAEVAAAPVQRGAAVALGAAAAGRIINGQRTRCAHHRKTHIPPQVQALDIKVYLAATLGEAPKPDWGLKAGWGQYLAGACACISMHCIHLGLHSCSCAAAALVPLLVVLLLCLRARAAAARLACELLLALPADAAGAPCLQTCSTGPQSAATSPTSTPWSARTASRGAAGSWHMTS